MLPESDDLEMYFHEMYRICPEYHRKRQEWKKAPLAAAVGVVGGAVPPLLALPPPAVGKGGKAPKRTRGCRQNHRHSHQRHLLLDLLHHHDTADLPPDLDLPVGNASHFCMYATVRQLVLDRWTRLANRAHMRSSYSALPSTETAHASLLDAGVCSDVDSDDDTEHEELVDGGGGDEENSGVGGIGGVIKVSKVVGFGLTTVFQLIRESRRTQPPLCARALHALLDVLQGQTPEGLRCEPQHVIEPLFDLLLELSTGSISATTPSSMMMSCGGGTVGSLYSLDGTSGPSTSANNGIHAQITALASACLLSLVVVRGDTGKIVTAIAGMLMCGRTLAAQDINMPLVLTALQRSIHSLLLSPDGEIPAQSQLSGRRRPDWITHGIPRSALVARFPVAGLPTELLHTCATNDADTGNSDTGWPSGGLQLKSMTSDGRHLYLFTSRGLVKVGSGFGGTERGYVYAYKPDFYPNDKGTLLYCTGNLYLKLAGRRGVEFLIVEKDTLLICGAVPLHSRDAMATVVFSDGEHLATISSAKDDGFIVRTLNHLTSPAALIGELPLKLARRCVDVLGSPSYEEDASLLQQHGSVNAAPSMHHQVQINNTVTVGTCSLGANSIGIVGGPTSGTTEDEVATIAAGKEFALIRTCSGKVLYSGRAAALGIKQAGVRASGKWAELVLTKTPKVTQVAIGHDGLHAVLLTEDGSVFFAGTARRGEDGDASNKARRQPKPTKPKKMIKVDGQFIVAGACNNGTTALVSRDGVVYMFGKDTAHADPCTGAVGGALRGECVVQVALGKAHALALTSKGAIYTFGINNKYQCGRDFVPTPTPTSQSIGISSKHEHQHALPGGIRADSAIIAMDTCCSDPVTVSYSSQQQQTPSDRHITDMDTHTTAAAMLDDYALYAGSLEIDGTCPGGNPDRLREVALSREHMCPDGGHTWHHDLCMVCTVCRECTGYGIGCLSMRPGRNPGQDCGCGEGDSGCAVCGCCRLCARDQPGQPPAMHTADAGIADPNVADISNGVSVSAAAVGMHRLDMIFRDKVKDLVQQRSGGNTVGAGGSSGRGAKLQDQVQSRSDEQRKSRSSRKSITAGSNGGNHKQQAQGKVKGSGASAKSAVATNTIAMPMSPVHRANLSMRQSNVLVKEGTGSDIERDTTRIACLPPAKLQLPVDSPVVQIACGLHHSLLLLQNGQVYSFGSNQYGQLGCSDILAKASIQLVKLPCSATHIAAGNNHSAVLTVKGEVYTFGNYQKGQLGRSATASPTTIAHSACTSQQQSHTNPAILSTTACSTASGASFGGKYAHGNNPRQPWYATPAPVGGVGAARHGRRATWVGASADQTYMKIDESLINSASLARSTVMANNNCIVLIPNHQQPQMQDTAVAINSNQSNHFHCLVINKRDGNCAAYRNHDDTNSDNVDGCAQTPQADLRRKDIAPPGGALVAVCLDPLYNVICAYHVYLQMQAPGHRGRLGENQHTVEVYNIVAAKLPVPLLPMSTTLASNNLSADGKPHHKGLIGRLKDNHSQGKLTTGVNIVNHSSPTHNVSTTTTNYRDVSFCSAHYYSLFAPELSLPTTTMSSAFAPNRDHTDTQQSCAVQVTRSQAAVHLLCCLDTLSSAHDRQLQQRQLLLTVSGDGLGGASCGLPVNGKDGIDAAVGAVGGAVGGKVGGAVDGGIDGGDGGGRVGGGVGSCGWRYSREDFQAVNRFESHGGGWGYSGHSIEAVRFMVDTDVLLGGFGLFGGRGEYTGKMKLLDIGPEGGEQEGDGDLLAETEELPYECGPRQKFPMLFEEPVPLQAHRWYVAWCRISGPSSDCGSSGQTMVTTEDQILFYFKSSKKSNNGTDVNAGQIPQLLYKVITPENQTPSRPVDLSEPPTHILSKEFSRSVSKECFQSLLALLKWSWAALKSNLIDAAAITATHAANVHVTLEIDRLVFISRACLHLLRMYVNEIYPSQIGTRRVPTESAQLAECVGDVRALLNSILSEGVLVQYYPSRNVQQHPPQQLRKQSHKQYQQSNSSGANNSGSGRVIRVDTKCMEKRYSDVLEMVLEECHVTFVKCFHAFYPTAYLKWTCLCQLLTTMEKQRNVTQSQNQKVQMVDQQPPVARLLSAVLAALCAPAVRLRSTLPLLSSSPVITAAVTPSTTTTTTTTTNGDSSNGETTLAAAASTSGSTKVFSQQQQPCNSSIGDGGNHAGNAGNHVAVASGGWYYPVLVDQMNYRTQIDSSSSSSGSSSSSSSPFRCSWKEVLDQLLALVSEPVTRALQAAAAPGQKLRALPPVPLPNLAKHCCHLLARVLGELVHQCNASEEDLQMGCGRVLHSTPSRFTRTNQSRTWNTGNGSPDAIAFHVDRPGVAIVGCSVYAGIGHYEYELELLEDQSNMGGVENHGHTQRWNTSEITRGSFGPEDFAPDVTEIKFDRAVPIKDGVKYALRLRNHGGRTNNGDGGLNSVRGSDGSTFVFSTCSLSFNGTSLTRGQIPVILYYSNPSTQSTSTDNPHQRPPSSVLPSNNNRQPPNNQHPYQFTPEQQARRAALSLTSAAVQAACNLLIGARVQLGQHGDGSCAIAGTVDQPVVAALGESHMVRTLLPLVLGMVGGLAANDPRSAVEILSYIHEMLPHVAALNLLAGQQNTHNIPTTTTTTTPTTRASGTTVSSGAGSAGLSIIGTSGSATLNPIPEHNWDETVITTTSQHYAWVQSDHPYKPATVSNYRVRFPDAVKWLSVEFDPACSTAQPEDSLQLYVPSSCSTGADWTRNATDAGANEHTSTEPQQLQLSNVPYWPVVRKFTSCMQWPTNAILLPGREVVFSLETASDYLKDDRASSYGFRCLVVGYEWPPGGSECVGDSSAAVIGLRQLESELAFLGGMCAASLIKKDLALPMNKADESEPDIEMAETVAANTLLQHGPLLAKGLVLSSPPNVTQALDATLPYGINSNERHFLRDFVNCSGSGSSSGARLAHWLQPGSRVDPSHCRLLHGQQQEQVRRGWPATCTILTRDQYGDTVHVPNMPVEVKAIPIDQHELGAECGDSVGRKMRRMSQSDSLSFGGFPPPRQLFEPTVRDKMCFHSITVMKAYQNYSFEELRYTMPAMCRSSESMLVRPNGDGTYTATWTPATIGCYSILATIDGYQMEEVLQVEVKEPPQGMLPPSQHHLAKKSAHQPSKLRRFVAKNSAGLRVRAHPSLQSEQIGIVHVNGTIAFMDEIHNDDGVWLRLSAETIKQYCNVAAIEAWCLQYNQHLGKTLLLPVEAPKSILDQVISDTIMRKLPEIHDSSRKSTSHNQQREEQKLYQVVACGASGHNVRTKPSLYAPTLGVLSLGERVLALSTTTFSQSQSPITGAYDSSQDEATAGAIEWCNADGRWVRLDAVAILCVDIGNGTTEAAQEAWSLAVGTGGVEYLRRLDTDHNQTTNKHESIESNRMDEQRYQQDQQHVVQRGVNSINKKRGFDFTPTSSPIAAPSAVPSSSRLIGVSSGKFTSTASDMNAVAPFTFTPPLRDSGRDIGAKRKGSRKDDSKEMPQQQARPQPHGNDTSAAGNPFVFGGEELPQQQHPGNSGAASKVGTTATPPPPRWYKTEDGRSDIPAELAGVSVKELVKVIGESRANGNGVTPPDTPRRACSPAIAAPTRPNPARLITVSRSSSSPISIPAKASGPESPSTSSSSQISSSKYPLATSSGIQQQQLHQHQQRDAHARGSNTRRGSNQSDTSALVSSLTRDSRDPSQSPSCLSSESPAAAQAHLESRDKNQLENTLEQHVAKQVHHQSTTQTVQHQSIDHSTSPQRRLTHQTTQTSPPGDGGTGVRTTIQFSIGIASRRDAATTATEHERDGHGAPRVSPKAMHKDHGHHHGGKVIIHAGGTVGVVGGVGRGTNKRSMQTYCANQVQQTSCNSCSSSNNSATSGGGVSIKQAVSPSVAEALRAVFAAFLWHEGLVHDAMAAASYLKFHPALPKEGEPVVTRTTNTSNCSGQRQQYSAAAHPAPSVAASHAIQWQRHSLEVTGGNYLINNIQPATLDALTRSAANASANRMQRRLNHQQQQQQYAIREDAGGGGGGGGSTTTLTERGGALGSGGITVTVLPPALKCLVWLWEDLTNNCMQAITHQISENSPVYKNGQKVSDFVGAKGERADKNIQEAAHKSGIAATTARNSRKKQQAVEDDAHEQQQQHQHQDIDGNSSVCELCGEWQPTPVTVHMKQRHPGCGRHAHGKGYNSSGTYCIGWAGNCGEGRVLVESSWYILCEMCREKYMKENRVSAGSSSQQQPRRKLGFVKSLVTPTMCNATAPTACNISSHTTEHIHIVMKNNAMFLLDLASSSDTDISQHNRRLSSCGGTSPATNHTHCQQQAHGLCEPAAGIGMGPFSGASMPPYFQCLQALGVADAVAASNDGISVYETAGEAASGAGPSHHHQHVQQVNVSSAAYYGAFTGQRPLSDVSMCPEGLDGGGGFAGICGMPGMRFHRSVSMGTNGIPWSRAGLDGRIIMMRKHNNASSACDIANEGVSSLLCHPSTALLKLVPHMSTSSIVSQSQSCQSSLSGTTGSTTATINLLQRPVMHFLLQYHDLDSLQLAMKQALRKAMCRVYAMQALNWLLRSVTQPVCLHDLLWWFVTSLSHVHNLSTEPHESEDDNNKHRRIDQHEMNVCEHPLSDITIAGEALHPLPATFHHLLQTIADLMVLLPMGSALQQMAVRCWGLRFSQADHSFLHRSQVFSNISKILSRSEEIEDTAISMHESHQNTNQASSAATTTVVESWKDLSSRVEIRASSRQAMVSSLTDESTETFWESGDEDRNKTKNLTVIVATPAHRPRMISVHVDNCRDLANKVSVIIFYSGPNSDELVKLRTVEVETRLLGGWLNCPIPDPHHSVIRMELKGPDNSVRVRQVRVLGEIDGESSSSGRGGPYSAATIQQSNCEAETLRVFRLITSQVFGKLILGNNSNNEQANHNHHGGQHQPQQHHHDSLTVSAASDCCGPTNAAGDQLPPPEDSNDLKEHMVGILFSRSRLTHLQKQVIVHIVQAIRKETIRSRDDFESSLLYGGGLAINPATAATVNSNGTYSGGNTTPTADTYCFEMLSMVLALSGSAVGRAYLGQQMGLVGDLMSLLHSGSARVQRQVTSLLRRILPEIAPEAFAKVIGVDKLPPKDFTIVSTANKDSADARFDTHRPGILDVFLSVIAKALTVQVKVKGKNDMGGILKEINTVTLSASIQPREALGSRWWMRGSANRKLAEVIVHLIKDMAAGKLSDSWVNVTKGAIAENIINLTQLCDEQRVPSVCLRTPTLWLALASLCVLDRDHVDRLSSGEWTRNDGQTTAAVPRPTCSNHDDGETNAVVQCNMCGNLCADCDRFLHLHKRTRNHQRQVCKEEEEAIKVEVHEGCGRTKLFWLLALADAGTLKALVEWRNGALQTVDSPAILATSAPAAACGVGVGTVVGVCRFCGATGSDGLLAIGNVCAEQECQEYGRTACCKVLRCGHVCGGVADEAVCLPCLHGCAPSSAQRLRQDADDMCMICFTEALSSAPAIQLKCGHVFHMHCCKTVLTTKWSGPRITFSFSLCPICKANIEHPVLDELLAPILELQRDVRRKALMRLEYEGLLHSHSATVNTGPGERSTTTGSAGESDPAAYAMDRYAYYVCFKCNKAYYGGEARCDAEAGLAFDAEFDPAELVCGACSDVARAQMCPKHGTDFLEYKCRYCCSVAVFFCFGTTHFCNACHDDFQRVTNLPKHDLARCPAGPKAKQLEGDECPLHVAHPPTGEEFALGCGVCRNAHTF